MSNKFIWVTFQKAGFHYYPAAAIETSLSDVSYLGNKHRHLFKFKVTLSVTHNDRDVEFHQLLNFCESLFESGSVDIDSKSVEMLADDLYRHLIVRYPGRDIEIEVSEDGECGCRMAYARN